MFSNDAIFADPDGPPPKAATWGFWFAVGSCLAAALSGPLIGVGVLPYDFGANLLVWSTVGCMIAGMVCAVGQALARRTGHPKVALRALLAVIPCVIIVACVYFLAFRFYTLPPIHDVTTNLEDPPRYVTITPRADLLADVPVRKWTGLRDMDNAQRWRVWHRSKYSDLKPVEMPMSIPEAIKRAQAIAQDLGWTIVAVDAAAGRLEATDRAPWFLFKDDIVIRAQQGPFATVLDLRATSRQGTSDLGFNADRIRAFYERLGVEPDSMTGALKLSPPTDEK
jgi:uncharacterized protein (DUF1499 family)